MAISLPLLSAFFSNLYPKHFPPFSFQKQQPNFTVTFSYLYSEDQQNHAKLSRLRNSERFQNGAKYLSQDKAEGQSGFSVSSLIIFSKGRISHLYHLSQASHPSFGTHSLEDFILLLQHIFCRKPVEVSETAYLPCPE